MDNPEIPRDATASVFDVGAEGEGISNALLTLSAESATVTDLKLGDGLLILTISARIKNVTISRNYAQEHGSPTDEAMMGTARPPDLAAGENDVKSVEHESARVADVEQSPLREIKTLEPSTKIDLEDLDF
jgi:hypothetical protein